MSNRELAYLWLRRQPGETLDYKERMILYAFVDWLDNKAVQRDIQRTFPKNDPFDDGLDDAIIGSLP